jgi:hypothetical protein
MQQHKIRKMVDDIISRNDELHSLFKPDSMLNQPGALYPTVQSQNVDDEYYLHDLSFKKRLQS